jgi:hypothetical protein
LALHFARNTYPDPAFSGLMPRGNSIHPNSLSPHQHLHERQGTSTLRQDKRVADFGTANATDFTTPVPPVVTVCAAQMKAQGLFDALNHPSIGLLPTISANFHGDTTAKSVLRDALTLE